MPIMFTLKKKGWLDSHGSINGSTSRQQGCKWGACEGQGQLKHRALTLSNAWITPPAVKKWGNKRVEVGERN